MADPELVQYSTGFRRPPCRSMGSGIHEKTAVDRPFCIVTGPGIIENRVMTKPNLRTLGSSDLHLTSIGFGAWAIGGGNWEFAWGPQDDNESVAAIHRALDLGINWIDTAAIYGLGHSEEVVARAVKASPHKPLIFTKCSMRWNADRSIYRSLTRASLTEELESSLRRLAVDTIDLYQIHWPNPEEEIEEGW